MKNIDLLHSQNTGTINEQTIEDLQLKCLNGNILADDELYDKFIDTLRHPLLSCNDIIERQNILKDFFQYPILLDRLSAVTGEAMASEAPPAFMKVVIFNNTKDKLRDSLDAVKLALEVPAKIHNIMHGRIYRSKTLELLCEQVSAKDSYLKLRDKLVDMYNYCMGGSLTLNTEFNDNLKLQNTFICSENTNENFAIKKLFARNVKTRAKNRFNYSENFLIGINIEDVIYNTTLNHLMYMIRSITSRVLKICAKINSDLKFYKAAIQIINYMESNGFAYTFPAFDTDTIKAQGVYDLTLACRIGCKYTVGNDFRDKRNSIYLLSGHNQGGKTTFLKSIGAAQLFAQSGLAVPAEYYECPIYNSIITHFQKDEDTNGSFGKLAEELNRFRTNFKDLVKGGLYLMNESFSTTTEKEGKEIAVDALRALSLLNVKVIFVTHLNNLLMSYKEVSGKLNNGKELVSLITCTTDDDSSNRTYKIIEGEPQDKIHTKDFIFKYIGDNHLCIKAIDLDK